MRSDAQDLLQRAAGVIEGAKFGKIAHSTALEYRVVADRLLLERATAGAAWTGPTAGIESRNTAAVRRAAWARRAVVEVAAALRDVRERRVTAAEGADRLALWVPEAERCPPLPRGDMSTVHRAPGPKPRPVMSKRAGLRELPADWLQHLWQAAVNDGHRHLNGLAILLVTGCRPAEATYGVAVRRVDAGLEISIVGAKVRPGAGQVWRRLTVADDVDGPAAYLLRLADAAEGGVARVGADCSPAAISMAVASLGRAVNLPRPISAYDIRHQRCADARIAFGGDVEEVARWLGHAGCESSRYYGRPAGGGCRGSRPVSVVTAAPVMRRERSGTLVAQPDQAAGPA